MSIAEGAKTIYDLVPEGVSVTSVLVCLWWFIKYIRKRDEDSRDESRETIDRLAEVGQRCHQHASEQTARYSESLDHVTKMFDKNMEVIVNEHRYTGDRLINKLDELRSAIEQNPRKPKPGG